MMRTLFIPSGFLWAPAFSHPDTEHPRKPRGSPRPSAAPSRSRDAPSSSAPQSLPFALRQGPHLQEEPGPPSIAPATCQLLQRQKQRRNVNGAAPAIKHAREHRRGKPGLLPVPPTPPSPLLVWAERGGSPPRHLKPDESSDPAAETVPLGLATRAPQIHRFPPHLPSQRGDRCPNVPVPGRGADKTPTGANTGSSLSAKGAGAALPCSSSRCWEMRLWEVNSPQAPHWGLSFLHQQLQ